MQKLQNAVTYPTSSSSEFTVLSFSTRALRSWLSCWHCCKLRAVAAAAAAGLTGVLVGEGEVAGGGEEEEVEAEVTGAEGKYIARNWDRTLCRAGPRALKK